MLNLPTADSPLREVFDVEELAKLRRVEIPMYRDALADAQRTIQGDKAIRAVHFIATSVVDGNVYLVRVGKRGGIKKLWNFGAITEVPW